MSAIRSRVRSESDYSYFDPFYQKLVRYTESPEEAVVSFKPGIKRDLLAKRLRQMKWGMNKPLDVRQGTTVFRSPKNQGWNLTARQLLENDQIANVIPALKDEKGLVHYFMPDELLIQLNNSLSPDEMERAIKETGCSVVEKHRSAGFYTLAVPADQGLFSTLRKISKLAHVEVAEPHPIHCGSLHYLPNDPEFPQQFAVLNQINCPLAWDFTRGTPNVIMAMIDTGIEFAHADLSENILPRGNEDWDFVAFSGRSPDDSMGHGTSTAGIAAAVDNTVNGIGVAPLCKILPLKVGFRLRNKDRVSYTGAVNAIQYVTRLAEDNPGKRYVMNASFGFFVNRAGALQRAIRKSLETPKRNVLFVASAGNDNLDLSVGKQVPAKFEEVICVANVRGDDVKANSSNFGSDVDVSAPGVGITTTALGNTTTSTFGGTSASAPFVTGLAGLIWSINPNLRNDEVRRIILNNCDPIDSLQATEHVNKLGSGRINAFRAVASQVLSIQTSPNPIDLTRNSTSQVTVSIHRHSVLTGPVTLSVEAPITGITHSFTPSTTNDTVAQLTLQVATNCPLGPKEMTLVATAGNIIAKTKLQIRVKAFSISLSQNDVTLFGNDPELKSDQVNITIQRSPGFTEEVTITISGVPQSQPGQGISALISPVQTTGNSATLTVSAGRFAPDMGAMLTITATSPTAQDSASFAVDVIGSDVAAPPGVIVP